MENEILLYQELALNSHPALQTFLYDGWVLKFANGHTNRANSINPLYPSVLDPQVKVDECEKYYFSQGLPTVFKLTNATGSDIDKVLEQRGYAIVAPTCVMNMKLGLLIKNGVPVACGLTVVERGYAALLNIAVCNEQRGRGVAPSFCKTLLSAAKRLGAHTSYLQVVQSNRAAVDLYEKLGFRTIYSYWYRTKNRGS